MKRAAVPAHPATRHTKKGLKAVTVVAHTKGVREAAAADKPRHADISKLAQGAESTTFTSREESVAQIENAFTSDWEGEWREAETDADRQADWLRVEDYTDGMMAYRLKHETKEHPIGYLRLNEKMRSGEELNGDETKMRDEIRSQMKPIGGVEEVWRGIRDGGFADGHFSDVSEMKPGDTFTGKHFVSTAPEIGGADYFGTTEGDYLALTDAYTSDREHGNIDVLIKINIQDGTKGIWTGPRAEQNVSTACSEYLLDAGQTFTVKAIHHEVECERPDHVVDAMDYYELEENDDDPDDDGTFGFSRIVQKGFTQHITTYIELDVAPPSS